MFRTGAVPQRDEDLFPSSWWSHAALWRHFWTIIYVCKKLGTKCWCKYHSTSINSVSWRILFFFLNVFGSNFGLVKKYLMVEKRNATMWFFQKSTNCPIVEPLNLIKANYGLYFIPNLIYIYPNLYNLTSISKYFYSTLKWKNF